MEKVTIRVPATSANLGSGFDAAGIAFALYNTFTFEKTESGLFFENVDPRFANEENLAYVAYKAVCDKIGVPASVKIVGGETGVPVSRGLGSSATLLAAGALAANKLHGNALSDAEIFEICNRIEGHPDNVAPALYGGLCLSLLDGETPITVKYPVSEKLFFTAVIPSFEVSTHDARAALPAEVPYKDAVFNLSRAALLSHAFTAGESRLISLVTKDALHEQYRKKLFRNVSDVEKAAYDEGALTFIISGAGSTCLCISERPIADSLNARLATMPNGWRATALFVDNEGAKEI